MCARLPDEWTVGNPLPQAAPAGGSLGTQTHLFGTSGCACPPVDDPGNEHRERNQSCPRSLLVVSRVQCIIFRSQCGKAGDP